MVVVAEIGAAQESGFKEVDGARVQVADGFEPALVAGAVGAGEGERAVVQHEGGGEPAETFDDGLLAGELGGEGGAEGRGEALDLGVYGEARAEKIVLVGGGTGGSEFGMVLEVLREELAAAAGGVVGAVAEFVLKRGARGRRVELLEGEVEASGEEDDEDEPSAGEREGGGTGGGGAGADPPSEGEPEDAVGKSEGEPDGDGAEGGRCPAEGEPT